MPVSVPMPCGTQSWFAAAGNPAPTVLQGNPDPGAEIRQLPAHRLTSLSRQINSFPVLHGRLIKSVEDNGIGRNANIYAELGSTWRFVMRDPTTAAHLLASS